MRNVFGKNLSHLDIDSFKKYLKGFANLYGRSWWTLDRAVNHFRLDKERYIKNIIRIGGKNESAYQLASDTLNTAMNLDHGTMPQVDFYFDSYSDIVRIHDALVALKNEQNSARRALYNMQEAERRSKSNGMIALPFRNIMPAVSFQKVTKARK